MRWLAALIILALTIAGLAAPVMASRGNVTNNGKFTFVYDFANQPTSIAGTGAATFLYDGNLKRVKEVRAGKTIYTNSR